MVEKMSLLQRLGAPIPAFFKKVRNIGLVLGAIGGAILSAPVSLPVIVVKIAGYLATAGIVASAVSQAAVDEQKLGRKRNGRTERTGCGSVLVMELGSQWPHL